MRYPFNRFYSDTFVFAAFTLIVVVLGALNSYYGFINYIIGLNDPLLKPSARDLEEGVSYAIIVVSAVILFLSHIKGNKNALHAIMGEFLALTIIKTIPFAVKYWTMYNKSLFQTFFMTYVSILAIATLFFFINHFVINSSPFCSPYKVFVNQLICAFLLVGLIVFYVQYLSQGKSLTELFSITTYVGVCNMVACVETNIDNAREIKEKNLA